MNAAAACDPWTALEVAWRRLCDAIDRGVSIDAARWMRVHQQLQRLCRDEGELGPSQPSPPSPSPAPAPITASTTLGLEKVESVFQDSNRTAPCAFDPVTVRATGPASPTAKPP
jgi:hypothetical protein